MKKLGIGLAVVLVLSLGAGETVFLDKQLSIEVTIRTSWSFVPLEVAESESIPDAKPGEVQLAFTLEEHEPGQASS